MPYVLLLYVLLGLLGTYWWGQALRELFQGRRRKPKKPPVLCCDCWHHRATGLANAKIAGQWKPIPYDICVLDTYTSECRPDGHEIWRGFENCGVRNKHGKCQDFVAKLR